MDDGGAGKGVLLDGSSRQRSGLSWYRFARVQLLAAPKQDGAPGATAWSALVLNGVTVPYEEVAGVRMVEDMLELSGCRAHLRSRFSPVGCESAPPLAVFSPGCRVLCLVRSLATES